MSRSTRSAAALPDVMNHNLETVPRLYKQARPGSDYSHSLKLLKDFKARFPGIPTKSGLMVGLGETDEEIAQVMSDLREHDVDMLTIGQYLQPSAHHLPVLRYVEPAIFEEYAKIADKLGFTHAACGPLVRSSYHADHQAHEAGVTEGERTRELNAGRTSAICPMFPFLAAFTMASCKAPTALPGAHMNILFAIGQVIALAGLVYGAILCITWREETDGETAVSKPRAKTQAAQPIASHRQYAAAAETDPAS